MRIYLMGVDVCTSGYHLYLEEDSVDLHLRQAFWEKFHICDETWGETITLYSRKRFKFIIFHLELEAKAEAD